MSRDGLGDDVRPDLPPQHPELKLPGDLCGALGGTRTPNLLIRRRVRGQRELLSGAVQLITTGATGFGVGAGFGGLGSRRTCDGNHVRVDPTGDCDSDGLGGGAYRRHVIFALMG
ncbi:unannotated protein [freshwater metagenome]|uniref:Unannotated protein n=1 Tax=freshwater metagenome TaxID=449393 RepID=A0A6J6DUA1_9ZZZZ